MWRMERDTTDHTALRKPRSDVAIEPMDLIKRLPAAQPGSPRNTMADGAFVADAIESFAPPDREIQELVTVSESTFRGLEPWLNAQ